MRYYHNCKIAHDLNNLVKHALLTIFQLADQRLDVGLAMTSNGNEAITHGNGPDWSQLIYDCMDAQEGLVNRTKLTNVLSLLRPLLAARNVTLYDKGILCFAGG